MTTAHDIDLRQLVEDRLTGASPDLLRELLSMFIDALMSAEADVLCGADYGQRSGDRVNVRNGYRHRDFDTRVGTLDVAIPRLRQGSYFPGCCRRIGAAGSRAAYGTLTASLTGARAVSLWCTPVRDGEGAAIVAVSQGLVRNL